MNVRRAVQVAKPVVFYQSVNGCSRDGKVTSTIEIGLDFTNVSWYDTLEQDVAELVTATVENQIANNYSKEDMNYLFENNGLTIKLVNENFTKLTSFKPGTCGLTAVQTHFNFFTHQNMGTEEAYAEWLEHSNKCLESKTGVPIPTMVAPSILSYRPEVDMWLKSLDNTYAVMKDSLDALYDCQRRLTDMFFN